MDKDAPNAKIYCNKCGYFGAPLDERGTHIRKPDVLCPYSGAPWEPSPTQEEPTMTSELRHDDYAPGGLLELASRCVTAVEQATASSSTTKAKIVANILRSFAAEKAAMADALVLENSDYAEHLAHPGDNATQADTDNAALVEELRELSSYVGAGLASDEHDPAKLIARIRWGVDHIQRVEANRAAQIVEELSKKPSTTWGEVKTAILAALSGSLPTQADTDNAALVEEAAERIMSYLFTACQPERGEVFSWCDDHSREIAAAALNATSTVGQLRKNAYPPNEGERGAALVECERLFCLLDDIDTADDWAKDNDKAFRKRVRTIQRLRFSGGITTDGYTVDLSALSNEGAGHG